MKGKKRSSHSKSSISSTVAANTSNCSIPSNSTGSNLSPNTINGYVAKGYQVLDHVALSSTKILPNGHKGNGQASKSSLSNGHTTQEGLEASKANGSASLVSKLGNGNLPPLENSSGKEYCNQKEILADTRSNLEQTTLTNTRLFPRHTHWVVVFATLIFRVWYVSNTENWWILHPDEVYQTVEVAHSEVYGYGFRAYEYLPPPTIQNSTSDVIVQEHELGMYSLRSFLLPRVISLVMWFADVMGVGQSPYLVAKVFHASVTSLLPLAAFYFTDALYPSANLGTMTSILVAASLPLNVFGTHTLLNSFLATFVFLSSIPMVKMVQKSRLRLKETNKKGVRGPKGNNILRDQNANTIQGPESTKQNRTTQNGRISEEVDIGETAWKRRSATTKCHENGKMKAGDKMNSAREHENQNNYNHLFTSVYQEFWGGLCLGVCVYIRTDIIILPVLLGICLCEFRCVQLFRAVFDMKTYMNGFLCGVLIGGFDDFWSYGQWFLSPCQWLKFNFLRNTSSVLFGSEPSTFYVSKLFFTDAVHLIALLVIMADFVTSFKSVKKHFSSLTVRESKGGEHSNVALAVFLCTLFVYSLNGHKELRFIHNSYIFLYILYGLAIIKIYTAIKGHSGQRDSTHFYLYLFICVYISSQLYAFINIRKTDASNWTYRGDTYSHHVNRCLDFLRQQDDVTGVYVDSYIQTSGAYTVLHHDVPVLCLNRFEFFEYDKTAYWNLTIVKRSSNADIRKTLTYFARLTDFISIANTPYLLKVLIEKSQYNYLVLDVDRRFIDAGYTEVYRSGKFKVIKRTFKDTDEAYLAKTASRIPLGSNATVLEYESYRLIQFGLYEIAKDKMLASIQLDDKRVGPYQLLAKLYDRFRMTEMPEIVLKQCGVKISKQACNKPYSPIKLHDTIYLDQMRIMEPY